MSTQRRSKYWNHRGNSSGTTGTEPNPAGFTLIELLVVVAIIAVLLSILLPAMSGAREAGRAAFCGQRQADLGRGLATYFAENNEWIPGVNTTGVATRRYNGLEWEMDNPRNPVQSFDWITPVVSPSTAMKENWADRWYEIMTDFQCPSQRAHRAVLYTPGVPEQYKQMMDQKNWSAISYLMPAHFQYWGSQYNPDHPMFSIQLTKHAQTGTPIYASTIPSSWEVVHTTYKSMVAQIGNPSQKIACVDGTRYLDVDDELDFDVTPDPEKFGSFTTSGAWWSGSTAFGVASGSTNWNGHNIDVGSPSRGHNLPLTYRHGAARGNLSGDVHNNRAAVNALFFDGSVRRLNDKESRNPVYWYPRGAKVRANLGTSEMTIELLEPKDLVP